MFRALWPTGAALREATRQFWSGHIRLENLIWAATLNIAILYVFGMIPLTGIEKSFTITDFWRWWVVHLWVEQSFEFFAASMSAYLLMAVSRSSIPCCTSTAQRTASTTLANSANKPSPVFFTTRPLCSAIFGLTNCPRWAFRRSCVPSSSAPIRREYPATSAARIAVRRRTEGI
jgi:hypothetical protein